MGQLNGFNVASLIYVSLSLFSVKLGWCNIVHNQIVTINLWWREVKNFDAIHAIEKLTYYRLERIVMA